MSAQREPPALPALGPTGPSFAAWRLEKASASFDSALQINPCIDAINNLGVVFYWQKRYYEGLALFDPIIAKEHGYVRA